MKSKRMHIPLLVFLLAVICLGLRVQPTAAGGWAVVTLEEWSAAVTVERPFTVTFAVRQHGQRLLPGLSPTVTAVHADTDAQVTVTAIETADPGIYAATLTLPTTGEWGWSIAAFTTVYPMPPLQATTAPPATERAATAVTIPGILGAAALATAVGLALVWQRQRRRVWLAGAAAALLVMLAALAWQWRQPPPLLAEEMAPPGAASAVTPIAMGEALFVAKGCTQCHQNGNVTLAKTHISSFGPDLTAYRTGDEFLRRWLADPAAVKPETEMPDLGLNEAEIEALILFLQAGTE